MNDIYQLLKKRILLLDGGMGSMIQHYNLKETDYCGQQFANVREKTHRNGDVLCITRPDIVQSIHKAYLEAGADIIETNSMNMTSISMADYGIKNYIENLNIAAATLAKEIAEKYTQLTPNKPRFVAGSIGPTNKSSSISPNVNNPAYKNITFDDLFRAYCEQIAALIFGGVDILLIETAFDTLNVKAALMAAEHEMKNANKQLPLMVSYTLSGNSGRILSGQTLEAVLASISHMDLLSIGLNCSFGAKTMKPFLKKLGEIAPYYVSAYPNAGLPNAFGEYNETPNKMAEQIHEYINESLVNIVGGCCGTTPQHINSIAHLINKCNKPIRKPTPKKNDLILSGLNTLYISSTNSNYTNCKKIDTNSNFIIIGERCNVAGSKKFLQLIQEKKYEEALKIAQKQIKNNAQILDVNVDDSLLNGTKEITTFLNLITSDPDTALVPIMIDSSDWNIIEAGLKCLQGKSIVNSISLKNGENDFLNKAKKIKSYGAAIIAMAFDEKGQADNFNRKITICNRMYKLLTNKIGFQPSDIIFDPNILAIATGIEDHNNYAIDFIKAIEWIKKKLPFAKVSGGISNLSFSFRGNNYLREAIHSVFLYYAINAGMDMGILNPTENLKQENFPPILIKLIKDVLFNCSHYSIENLTEYIQKQTILPNKKKNKNKKENEWRTFSVIERLKYAIIKGVDDFLETDLQEAIKIFPQVIDIIDQPLMEGMNRVSNLFGQGKMFLPQIVKTARIMKKAVIILQPYLKTDKKKINKSGKILFATVKGDVHDIGKNIVSAILSCNNYEIIDIGVMVPSDEIIRKAKKYQVDIVALSGLITPSLEEMSVVALEMEKAGLSIPLLIGGATTSKLHTALKIDPLYHGAVVHVSDASKAVLTANNLIKYSDKENYIKEIKNTYSNLRQHTTNSLKELVSLEYARNHPLKINHIKYNIPRPIVKNTKILNSICIKNIIPYINWASFLSTWKLPIQYANSFQEKKQTLLNKKNPLNEATHLMDEAKKLLSSWVKINYKTVRAIIGFYPVKVQNESLIVNNKNIPLLRQQEKRKDNIYKSLIDFINPLGDYIGFFVVTAGENINLSKNTYSGMLEQILRDRLVEAAAEYLHEKVRKKYWGYAPNESFTPKELLKAPYQGIRPSSGYAAHPDISLNFIIDDLLKMKKIGLKLTPNGAIFPSASIAGIYIAHPKAIYFYIGQIDDVQLFDYATKKGISINEAKKWLGMCTKMQ